MGIPVYGRYLETNIFGPDLIRKGLPSIGGLYDSETVRSLYRGPLSKGVVDSCRGAMAFAFAGPPRNYTLLELLQVLHSFITIEDPQEFLIAPALANEQLLPAWIVIDYNRHGRTCSTTRLSHKKKNATGIPPTLITTIWCLAVHSRVTDERLMGAKCIVTSSLAADGKPIAVRMGDAGLIVITTEMPLPKDTALVSHFNR